MSGGRSDGRDLLVLAVSAEVAGHLCIALQQHVRWARGTGLGLPEGLKDLEVALATRARRGQQGTPLEDLWSVRHAAQVSPKLLSYAAAAQILGVGERTVKRLVAAGDLPVVRVLGSARIRVEQLDSYIEQL